MAVCPNCGNELPESALYCPGCGANREQVVAPSPPQVNPPSLPPTPGPRKVKRGFPKGAIIAIIAGCITVIIIVVLVVLLSISVVNVFKKPADAANAYIKAVSAGNLDTAWDYLSARTKAEKDRATLESDVRGLEGQIKRWNTRSIQIEDHRAQIAMDVEFKSGQEATVYLYLVKEAGEWKVSSAAETPFPGFEEHKGV